MSLTRRPPRWAGVLAFLLFAPAAHAGGPTKRECVAANESAQDLRHAGKLRQARTAFAMCAAATCPRAVRDDCAQSLAEVEASMPSVVLVARDRSNEPLTAVSVEMDGAPFVDALDGSAVEVDPGAHTFSFREAGAPPVEKTVFVGEGEHVRRVEVVLGAPAEPSPRSAPAAPPPPPSRDRSGTMIGLAMGGVGVLGVAAGAVLGLVAKSTYDRALHDECHDDSTGCSAQGYADGKTAHAEAAGATVAWAVGGALVAAGVVTYFVLPGGARASVSPTADSRGGGLAIRGSW